jgi:hypothetical protein
MNNVIIDFKSAPITQQGCIVIDDDDDVFIIASRDCGVCYVRLSDGLSFAPDELSIVKNLGNDVVIRIE